MIAMCRRIAQEEGLSAQMTREILATVECESNFNNEAVNINRNKDGSIASTDFYLAQVNDFYHIGDGKDFPSVGYVHENPDKVFRWMCRLFKAGKADLWECHKQNLLQKYGKDFI